MSYRELKNCPWCKGNDIEKVAERDDRVAILRCKDCGIMFAEKIPPSLKDLYSKEYFEKESHKETQPIGYLGYQQAILQNLPWQVTLVNLVGSSPGHILDIGCATGEFLEIMQRLGWQATGYEISQWAVKIGREEGLQIYQGEFEENKLKAASFEAISAWEFLEHVLNLRKTLEEIKRLLKPKGVFFFSTPNSQPEDKENWLGLKFSFEHIFYLEKRSLEKILKEVFGVTPTIVELGEKKETLVGFLVLGEKPLFLDKEKKELLTNLLNSLQKTGIAINSVIQIKFEVLEEKLRETKENMLRAKEELRRLKEEMIKIKKEKEELQNTLKAIYTSKSWKITAPLRKIPNLLRIKDEKEYEESSEKQ